MFLKNTMYLIYEKYVVLEEGDVLDEDMLLLCFLMFEEHISYMSWSGKYGGRRSTSRGRKFDIVHVMILFKFMLLEDVWVVYVG